MNEIMLSTQVAQNRTSRLSIKMDVEKLGVNWNEKDIIRIRSYKKDGSVILCKVDKKVAKTVNYQLTKTGGGSFSHDLGIYVAYKPRRFAGKFKSVNNVAAAARFIDKDKKYLQVFLPKDLFVDHKGFSA